MKHDNVAAVRNAYAVAERKDLEGWINLFTPDGVFTNIRWVRPTVVAPSPTWSEAARAGLKAWRKETAPGWRS
jgi:ketosteroid isomerase-like protein